MTKDEMDGISDSMDTSLSKLQELVILHPWNFLGKSTGVGCHFLLQGIFLTQGSNLPLLYQQVDSLPLSQMLMLSTHGTLKKTDNSLPCFS